MFVLGHQASAIDLSAFGGGNVSQLGAESSATGNSGSSTSDGYLSYTAGMGLQFWLSKKIAIAPELIYNRRKVGSSQIINRMTFLENVWMAKWTAFPFLVLGGGVYVGYPIGKNEVTYLATTSRGKSTERQDFNATGLKAYEFGYVGSLRGQVLLGRGVNVFGDFRYKGALFNQSKTENVIRKFTDLQLLAGIEFGLGRASKSR